MTRPISIALSLIALFATLALSTPATAKSKPKPIARHLIFIGLDGWGSYSMAKANMPNTKRLMQEGCYTLKKRTVLPSSSAPNWASMFMGAGVELHGYTTWGSKAPDTPARVLGKHNIFPTIFQVYRDAYPEAEIGVLYEWAGIKYLVDTLACSYHDIAAQCLDHPERLGNMAADYIKNKRPNLLAICYDNPDHVGHAAGHDTPEYYRNLEELDGYIGQIVDAVRQAGMLEQTIFIVTADHGGINKNHGGISMQEMETPFIIAGKGIKQGGEFQESMIQADVAATMAHIFGLEQPQVWVGRPMTQVFKK